MYGVIDDKRLAGIATAIREKTGTETTYTPEEMAQGVAAVYDAGKQAEGLTHWKAITNNGTRSNSYDYAFAYSDYSDVQFPKPIVMTGELTCVFRMYNGEKLPRKQDIDMTGAVSANSTFSYIWKGNRTVTIPDYGIPAVDSYISTYDNAQRIETIEVIRCHEGTTFTSSAFVNCFLLKNVTFEGVIGKSISMSSCPLSVPTLKNIISCLKDYTGTDNEYAFTVTFKASAFAALEAEGVTAEYNGTPCTWAELIDNKKWNLTLAS